MSIKLKSSQVYYKGSCIFDNRNGRVTRLTSTADGSIRNFFIGIRRGSNGILSGSKNGIVNFNQGTRQKIANIISVVTLVRI